jgi:hypothetical protein
VSPPADHHRGRPRNDEPEMEMCEVEVAAASMLLRRPLPSPAPCCHRASSASHGRRRPGTRPDLATGDGERLCYAGHRAEEEEGREAPTLCPPGGAPPARDSPRRELCSVADRTGRMADADWSSVAGAPFVFGSSASSPVSPTMLLCAAGGARDQPTHLARRRSPCCRSLCLATPRRRGR